MLEVKQGIIENLRKVVKELTSQDITPNLEHPKDERHGDYSSNIALAIFNNQESRIKNQEYKSPLELAKKIADKFMLHDSKFMILSRIEAVAPGFINFWLSKDYLPSSIIRIIEEGDKFGFSDKDKGKRIMVEFAHPNTHKEMHIGHMRTLITGEAMSRIFEAVGAKVYRANYQGDIGPHVAKAIYGIQKIFGEKGLTIDTVEEWTNKEKAHFLGEAYVRGNQEYKEYKDEVDGINAALYRAISRHSGEEERRLQNLLAVDKKRRDSGQSQNDESIIALYLRTRQWSLDYYDEFYKRFYTKFDKLFFESEMVVRGKDIVEKNLGRVFKRDQGAIVFKGEPYGLHTRVFITQAGYLTYEGKEMANAFEEYEAFNFDKKIHIVASEQAEYFKVVFKALELIDPEKFKGCQYHIPMGMVHLVGKKMSSRTGDILTVDSLIDRVKEKVNSLVEAGKIKKTGTEDVAEKVAIGAIKYSVLKVDTKQEVAFDIEKSVSLEGNSGPYLQYTFARTQSVLRKSEIRNPKHETNSQASPDQNPNIKNVSNFGHLNFDIVSNFDIRASDLKLEPEEVLLLRTAYRFPEIVEEAAEKSAPNIICNYLFDLAQKFNLFYQRVPIIKQGIKSAGVIGTREFRLALTVAVGQVIKNGLNLLGISAPERM